MASREIPELLSEETPRIAEAVNEIYFSWKAEGGFRSETRSRRSPVILPSLKWAASPSVKPEVILPGLEGFILGLSRRKWNFPNFRGCLRFFDQKLWIYQEQGGLMEDHRLGYEISLEAEVKVQGGTEMIRRSLCQFSTELPGRSPLDRLIHHFEKQVHDFSLDRHSIPSGIFPIVFSSRATAELIRTTIVPSLIARGGALRGKVAKPILSIKEVSGESSVLGKSKVDDLGEPYRSQSWIKAGEIQLDPSMIPQRRLTTRHERSAYPASLRVQPSDLTRAQFLEGIRRGVYIDTIGGVKVNPETGEFAFEVSHARLISCGQVAGPLCRLQIRGDIRSLLRDITHIGKASQVWHELPNICQGGYPHSIETPELRVSKLQVDRV